MKPFKNFTQLAKHFNNELTCALFLEEQRWGGKPLCPHCGSEYHSRTQTRFKHPELKEYKDFRCKACDKKYTVLTGSVYESSHISLQTWFQAVYLISAHKKGISSLQLASDLGVTQKTAWFMLHRLRKCFVDTFTEKLGVNGEVVETDETIVGGKTHNKTREYRNRVRDGKVDPMGNKSIVMGMIQRKDKLYMQVLSGKSQILSSVANNVSTNASLITDSSGVYKSIKNTYPKHEIIDHSSDEYVRGNIHTNSIEGAFSLFDRMVIGIYHFVSPKHLQRYCDEFMFRWNHRRLTDVEKFVETLKKCDNTRLQYKDLIS